MPRLNPQKRKSDTRPPQEYDERRKHLLDHPELFVLTYFPHRIRKLEEFHLGLIDVATSARRGLVLYPAAHGKTTLVAELLPIWALCRDPNIRMALIAKNDNDAKSIMQSIMAELQGNEELIADYGPFYAEDKPWGLEKLSVAKRTIRAKSPTLVAMGSGSRGALGHRTDWTICDDVVTDQNSRTPEARAKLKEWFMQGPATMAQEWDDRLTVVGTLFDPQDLYHDLETLGDPDSGNVIWTVYKKDAVVDEQQRLTLWPAQWPWSRLMELKAEMGTLDFNKRLRNIAVDKSRMAFREEYIRGGFIGKQHYPGCLDKNYSVGDADPAWRLCAGFDPAVGLTKSRKFCAHVVLAQGSCQQHEKCLWVVDVARDQLTLPQQVDLILSKHQEHDLISTWIEANSYQMGLHQAVKSKMDETGLALRIDPHYTTRTNKPDPEIGVQAMARWFEDGKVHIPWGSPGSQRMMMQLVDELIMYPGRYTDTVMALWIGWRALQESVPRYQTSSYLKKPMMWGTRPGRRRVMNPYYVR